MCYCIFNIGMFVYCPALVSAASRPQRWTFSKSPKGIYNVPCSFHLLHLLCLNTISHFPQWTYFLFQQMVGARSTCLLRLVHIFHLILDYHHIFFSLLNHEITYFYSISTLSACVCWQDKPSTFNWLLQPMPSGF